MHPNEISVSLPPNGALASGAIHYCANEEIAAFSVSLIFEKERRKTFLLTKTKNLRLTRE